MQKIKRKIRKWNNWDICVFATIVANNPTNVFEIFANILAIILRHTITAINQMLPFLLLLLLTLRVSNQRLPSPNNPSLLDPLSPFPQSTFKTSSLIPFIWLVMHLIPLLSQFNMVCLLPLGLWILLVAITWHLTHPYFLKLNLHHTFLIFAQQMIP